MYENISQLSVSGCHPNLRDGMVTCQVRLVQSQKQLIPDRGDSNHPSFFLFSFFFLFFGGAGGIAMVGRPAVLVLGD